MRTRDELKVKAIHDKAIELIVRKGLDGLSMQKLAKAAGVSPATLYIYFKDRDDLIVQLCAEEHRRMADATLKDFDPEMHFEEGLRVQWINRAEFCLENPLNLSFMEQIKHTPYHSKAMEIIDDSFRQAMMKFVKTNRDRGELIKVSVEVYWAVAYAPLYQLLKYHIQGKSFPGSKPFRLNEDVLSQALKMVVKALQP